MDLLKKLEECKKRYDIVQKEVMSPELVKDPKKYKETMRENNYLSELCALYDEYKKVLQGIEDDKVSITEEDDQDMKEMAREELKERYRSAAVITSAASVSFCVLLRTSQNL